MTSSALCIARAPQMQQSTETLSGYFVMEGTPCESTVEPCLPCLTLAFQSNETLYYLTSDNDQMMSQLNEIEAQFIEGQHATINGISYQQGSYNYINVQTVSIANSPLPSLCDEWNVWYESFESFGPISFDKVVKYKLTTDTLINGQQYVKLTSDKDSPYLGAMREGNNRDIYYIPANSTHEYLLYAFNAQVGDTLSNLWVGGFGRDYQGVAQAISNGSPRLFTIRVLYPAGMGVEPGESFSVTWIEGVGSPETPYGLAVVPTVPADVGVYTLLCAYKKGEQIYVSEFGEQYGCEYNGNGTPEPMFTSDTEWHYKSYDMFAYTDYTPTLSSISLVDTLINNIPYQKIGGILFRTKGTKVWCTMDSLGTPVERLVYDFGLQVGDSIRNVYYDEEFWMEQEYIRYAKVTSVEYITLSDGRSARRISYDNYRPDDIEHIGSVEGILFPLNFPVAECGCGDAFKCCTRNDFLLYEVSTGACDDFFEAEQPADTIPLLFSYTGDDPGSSTVDPVDPNQVVATLQGDQLTIHENMGVDITYSLQNNAPAQTPAQHRTPQNDTFRNEVTIQITESGEYRLFLTNPSWDYIIYGRFTYVAEGIERVESASAPQKTLINGQIYILRGDKTYTITGQEVR